MNSAELVAQYRDCRSEEAFSELVRRYTDLVFSVAKRRLGSEALAEEAAQIVFIRLAEVRPRVPTDYAVVGWLHRTALHVSIDLVRSEMRRRVREEKSMQVPTNEDESTWQELTPFLDEALDRLKDDERGVLLLRFFDRKAFAEIGAAYRISEDAAKMRVARALEKLRGLLANQKVFCTPAVLSALLLSRAVEAAPAVFLAKMASLQPPAGPRPFALHVGRRAILIGTGCLLLVGTVLVSRQTVRTQPTSAPPAQSPASKAAEVPEPSAALPNRNETGPSRFDPITTRTVLSLVHADTGAPIPGARVRVAYFYEGGVGEGHKLISNSEGKAPVPFANKEGDHGANIFVTADGFVPKVLGLGWRDPFPEIYEMKLDPALTFAGFVVNEDGEPVPNATITLECSAIEHDTRKAENVAFNSPETAAHTDSAGAFVLPYVPRELPPYRFGPSEVRLNLAAEGFQVTQTNFTAPLVARSDLRLVIRKGAVVTGRVVGPNGRPVANAKVRELHNFGVRKATSETDDEGWFTLAGVYHPIKPEVRVVVQPLQPEGFACQEKTVMLTDRTNMVNFELTKSPVFRGRVVDKDGVPLGEVTIRTDSDHEGIRKYEWLDVTNVDGRFEWTSAPAEETLFWFEKNGFQTIRGMPLTPNGTEYEIVLQKVGSTRKVQQSVNVPKYTYKFYEPPSR